MNDTLRQWKRDTVWYVIGCVTGAGVMIYVNSLVVQPTKPVVTVEQTKADETRHLQRVHELRFSLAKEERLQKERFAEAVANRDSIREMVAKLGDGK